MSITAFKKKGVIRFGTKISGKIVQGSGGTWLPQGPFGPAGSGSMEALKLSLLNRGISGFSINGGTRNVGYVGQSMAMSKNGTPFYGVHAKGYGGVGGRYPRANSVFNAGEFSVLGNQSGFIKPSVLSNKGMLERRFKWINNGQYPNAWVQPVYGNTNLSDNASSLLYTQKKAAAYTCVNDTNKPHVYASNIRKGGANGCATSSARRVYSIQSANGLYTKTLSIPQTSGQYTIQVQRQCANPIGAQKPFPFAVSSTGSSGANHTPGPPPPILTETYLSPPEWYTAH